MHAERPCSRRRLDKQSESHCRAHLTNLKSKLVSLLPCARDVILIDTINTPNDSAAFTLADYAALNKDQIANQLVCNRRTVSQRSCGTVLTPSTSRRREASENATSGMNTEQRTCAQHWPSVGLQARRKVSTSLSFSVSLPLPFFFAAFGGGQRTQSVFNEASPPERSFSQRSHSQEWARPGSGMTPHAPAWTLTPQPVHFKTRPAGPGL